MSSVHRPKKAVIIAAGMGNRLKPFTNDVCRRNISETPLTNILATKNLGRSCRKTYAFESIRKLPQCWCH